MMTIPKCARLLPLVFLLLFLPACGLVNSLAGGKTTELTLDTTPTSIPSGTQLVFTAEIIHNNGNFAGANWALTSNGTACTPGCGTLSNPTNTGSSGNGDTATITYTAPSAIPNPDSVTITATSVENSSSSGSDTFTITTNPLSLQSVGLPNGTVGVAYASTTLEATGGTTPYSWSVVSGNLPSGISLSTQGVLSGTPSVAATFTFTVQVQDSESTPATATAAESITVVTVNGSACGALGGKESLLNGQYAFLLEGSDPTGSNTMVGGFTADGAGNISAGEEDLNFSGGVRAMQPITAANNAYTVGSDNRGCLAITTGGATYVYRFTLGSINAGVASKGRLVEFDNSGTIAAGVMKLRDTSAFNTAAINGNYAFAVADPRAGQFAAAGAFSASAGVVSAGAVDTNLAGNIDGAGAFYPASALTFTGSDSVDANGRATLSFSLPTASGAINNTCYVVSATELYCMSSDAQGANPLYPLFAGTVLQQASVSFTNSSLNGTSVRYLSGLATSGTGVKVEIGLLQTDGAGNFSYNADTDDGGSFSSPGAAGTYSVAANGRVTASGGLAPIFYLVNANEAFGIGTSANVTSGFFEPQSAGPFTNASLNAAYSFGQLVPSAEFASSAGAGQFQTGEIVLDGAGNVSGTTDIITSSDALFPNQSLAGGTYAVSSNGRGTVTYNGSISNVFYVISPTRAVVIDSGPVNPEIQLAEQ
jgi:hypothetical protein